MQDESAQLERQVGVEQQRSVALQRDLAASLRDSKEALHREVDIMAQLEAQDEVHTFSIHLHSCTFLLLHCLCVLKLAMLIAPCFRQRLRSGKVLRIRHRLLHLHMLVPKHSGEACINNTGYNLALA